MDILFFFFIVVLFPFFLGTLFSQWLSLNLKRLSPLNYKLHAPCSGRDNCCCGLSGDCSVFTRWLKEEGRRQEICDTHKSLQEGRSGTPFLANSQSDERDDWASGKIKSALRNSTGTLLNIM